MILIFRTISTFWRASPKFYAPRIWWSTMPSNEAISFALAPYSQDHIFHPDSNNTIGVAQWWTPFSVLIVEKQQVSSSSLHHRLHRIVSSCNSCLYTVFFRRVRLGQHLYVQNDFQGCRWVNPHCPTDTDAGQSIVDKLIRKGTVQDPHGEI